MTETSEQIDIRELPGTFVVDAVQGQGYFPVIAALNEKEVAIIHRAGDGHVGINGRLDCVHSSDCGRTWEEPAVMIDSDRDDRNPAVGLAFDGTLIVGYQYQGSYNEEGKFDSEVTGKTDTRLIYSRDNGITWGDDAPLNFTPLNGVSPFGKIRAAPDGSLLMPIYGGPFPDHVGGAYLLRSRDNGLNWQEPIFVGADLGEPDLLFLANGDWLLAARTGPLVTCRSSDEGKSWSKPEQVTEVREHPPDLTLLNSGQILLLFGRRNPPYGVQGIVSSDGGRSWDSRRLLYADDLPGRDIGYPSTVRFDGGKMLTAFYTAGTADNPHQFYDAVNVACRVVCYEEEELLAALD